MEDKKVIKMFESIQKGQQKIQKSLGYVTEMVAENSEDITLIKEDVSLIKEELVDVHATTNRIETTLNSEIKYVDVLSKRVTKLEAKKI